MFKKTILVSVFGLVIMGLLVLGLGFAAGWFVFSNGGTSEPLTPLGPPAPAEAARGIDVSSFQGSIDWEAVRGDTIVFAYARAADGTQPDPAFQENWSGMQQARLMRGAYHYFVPNQDVEEQAQFFIAQLNGAGSLGAADLPPALFVSESGGVPSDSLVARIQSWLRLVWAELDRLPIVFTTQVFYEAELGGVVDEYPLWISSIGREPSGLDRPWTFWQYAAEGQVSGVSGEALLDRFSGSVAELEAFVRSTRRSPASSTIRP